MNREFLFRFFELTDADGFEILVFQFVKNLLFRDGSQEPLDHYLESAF